MNTLMWIFGQLQAGGTRVAQTAQAAGTRAHNWVLGTLGWIVVIIVITFAVMVSGYFTSWGARIGFFLVFLPAWIVCYRVGVIGILLDTGQGLLTMNRTTGITLNNGAFVTAIQTASLAVVMWILPFAVPAFTPTYDAPLAYTAFIAMTMMMSFAAAAGHARSGLGWTLQVVIYFLAIYIGADVLKSAYADLYNEIPRGWMDYTWYIIVACIAAMIVARVINTEPLTSVLVGGAAIVLLLVGAAYLTQIREDENPVAPVEREVKTLAREGVRAKLAKAESDTASVRADLRNASASDIDTAMSRIVDETAPVLRSREKHLNRARGKTFGMVQVPVALSLDPDNPMTWFNTGKCVVGSATIVKWGAANGTRQDPLIFKWVTNGWDEDPEGYRGFGKLVPDAQYMQLVIRVGDTKDSQKYYDWVPYDDPQDFEGKLSLDVTTDSTECETVWAASNHLVRNRGGRKQPNFAKNGDGVIQMDIYAH